MIAAPHGRGRRADIQALRGLAVLLVILFHSDLPVAPAGYLGVDIFFVISGFLITGILMRQIDAGRFRFRDFYLRRVRRLVPAAYAMLTAATFAAILLLTPSGYRQYWPQLLGALGFAGNVVLWQQINYFNTSAALAPLLHMWSLAVEEQFYLVLPLALVLIPRRLWFGAILVGVAASFAGYVWLSPRSPGLAFYLLPTRGWEIGLGSLGASLAVRTARQRSVAPAWCILASLFLVPRSGPAWVFAGLACLATLGILLNQATRAAEGRFLRPLIWFGDRSYALYLVHWPPFAFLHILYLGDAPPMPMRVATVLLAIGLGVLLYHGVEEPARRAAIPARTAWRTFAAASVALALFGAAGLKIARSRATFDLRGVTGLAGPGCDGQATRFDGRCANADAPTLLVWGDSFSQHLIPALLASGATAIAQASKGQCAPLLGIAPVDADATAAFARGCLAFNRSVLVYLAATPSVRVVVLSGYYQRYAQPETAVLRDSGEATADLATVIAAQRRTTQAIRSLGKRVVVVSGPPQARFDIGQCWERTLAGVPILGNAPRCAIGGAGADRFALWTAALMAAFSAQAATPVVRLDRLMCPRSPCQTIAAGVPLYRDANHLSEAGSAIVGRRLALTPRALQVAQ